MSQLLKTAAVAVAAAVLLSPASAAAAGWTSPKAVQPGVNPILSFSPTGTAAVGSELLAHGRPAGSELDLASSNGVFVTDPWTIGAPAAGHGPEPLARLALSSTGQLAAGFFATDAPTPVLARVATPAPSSFAPSQQLVPLGGALTGQAVPDSAAMLATSDGEIVAAGTDDAGALDTAVLGAHRTRFALSAGPAGFASSDDFMLAGDLNGDTFLAGDGANGCSTVAVRPAHGHFRTTYRTGNCSSSTPNIADAITATGHAEAALLSEDVSESGTGVSRLLIQVGRDGRFGAATQLGGAYGGSDGLASDADGSLTAEWTGCVAGPITNGLLTLSDCAIDAASGSISTGVSSSAAAGTTLARARTGTTLSAITADRAVAISRCPSGARTEACAISVATVASGGRFRAAHALGAGRLITLVSDDHGNLLAVWVDSHDRLFGATGSAASGRWSADHRLTAAAINPATVTAAYGPRQRAIIAWSTAAHTVVASYAAGG